MSDEAVSGSGPSEEVEGGKKPAAVWRVFSADEIKKVAADLVHFSVKTVNSNAAACGVRLGPEAGLALPYVSARTLMGAGVALDLDYAANAGTTATVVKQINAVQRDDEFAKAATPGERSAIENAVSTVRRTPAIVGDGAVDARVRQLLIPRLRPDGSAEGYVSMSPLTAGGVCQMMLAAETGLVARHNVAAKAEAETAKGERALRRIRQAKYGIGGSNPQNVGGLVRSMQRPLFVQGPSTAASSRAAFALYYRGFEIEADRKILVEYREFRGAFERDGKIGAEHREAEREIFSRLARGVVQAGERAFDVLSSYAETLPREHLLEGDLNGDFELVSRKVSGVVRGLIDPRLRDIDHSLSASRTTTFDWPRKTAQAIAASISKSLISVGGEKVVMTPLDGAAQSSVISMIEESLR